MRIVFMGTPEFSVPPLKKIMQSHHEVVAVYCQPPRRSGRGMGTRMSPVHQCAHDAGCPVFTPVNFREVADREVFASHEADVGVVIAYGLILPAAVLNAPRLGCFNLHASKLPRWRGAAPIQRAIMAGDSETAAMVMRMDEGLDTGPVCLSSRVGIGADMTAGELHDQLSQLGADLIIDALDELEAGTLKEAAQSESGITYADKIDKAEGKIDFSRDAADVHNLIRGLSPFPGAWFEASRNGKVERIKVLRSKRASGQGAPGEVLSGEPGPIIACGSGAIHLEQVQRSGKRPALALEFLRGFAMEPGTRVG